MEIYIDNKNLNDYGITVLDYTGALSFASERENEREWADKSGIDKNLINIRYDSKEFVLSCIIKGDNVGDAYNKLKDLIDDMFDRGCVVLSLRDTVKNIRECFIVERSTALTGDIKVREQNSLYYFKLGLKDINPNAVKYKTTIASNSVTINYTKGQTAVIYWGNGEKSEVSNSGDYTKDDYTADGLVDIIIDIDSNSDDINPLAADFEINEATTGLKPYDVTFNDLSTGDIVIWNWDFGDGETSDEQNPAHTYSQAGIFTVTLQIFNGAQGSDIETKIDYITVNAKEFDVDSAATDQIEVDDLGQILLIN